MLKRVDHIAILVKDLDAVLATFKNVFGLEPVRVETVGGGVARAALFQLANLKLEMAQPLDPNGFVARQIQEYGEGINHISLEVEDVEKELAVLTQKGVELVDKKPRQGLMGKIALISRRATHGIPFELVQKT